MKTRREKNRKRRTIRRVFKKYCIQEQVELRKMKKKVEIGKEE